MKKQPLRVAAIQYKGDRFNQHQHQSQILNLIESALQQNAQVVVCPEMADCHYLISSPEEADQYAYKPNGIWAHALQTLANQFKAWLIIGIVEKEERTSTQYSPYYFNSALILSPFHTPFYYRKRLLYLEDLAWAIPGDTPHPSLDSHLPSNEPYPCFNVYGYKMTVGICMDLNDERFTDFCAQQKIDLIAFPTNWLDEEHEVYSYWAWRLQESNALLVAANTYGREERATSNKEVLILPENQNHALFDLENNSFAQMTSFRGESAILSTQPACLYALASSDDPHILYMYLPIPQLNKEFTASS